MVFWRKEHVLMLINMYRDYPALWNTKNPEYRDKRSKNALIDEIVVALEPSVPGLTSDDVKKKIHTLRTQYRKEIRDIETMQQKAGAGVEIEYQPRFWCFDEMDFLHNVDMNQANWDSSAASPVSSYFICLTVIKLLNTDIGYSIFHDIFN